MEEEPLPLKPSPFKPPSFKPLPLKVLLVDGYNVLRSGPLYRSLAQDAPDYGSDIFNAAREALLNDVASFASRDFAATVVFDAANNPHSRGQLQHFGSVCYLFSPCGTSADTVIEALAHAAVQEGREVVVVSSDATLQWTVFGKRVTRMSAVDFCKEVVSLRALNQKSGAPVLNTSAKNTLSSLLDAQTREALEKLARGE
ncbi:MAG: NYN domain-containing protein [Coriobacteriales bacterium]|jgi:predicted RNA-binding protein with PIN domain|nr:NYN domain-containing protein [Coriobacteriales bacterium]